MFTINFLTNDPWYYQTNLDYRFYVPDKAQHFYGSYFLAYLTSTKLSLICGLLKEIYDNQKGVGFSYRDIIANCLGILANKINKHRFKLWVPYDQQKHQIKLMLTFQI